MLCEFTGCKVLLGNHYVEMHFNYQKVHNNLNI